MLASTSYSLENNYFYLYISFWWEIKFFSSLLLTVQLSTLAPFTDCTTNTDNYFQLIGLLGVNGVGKSTNLSKTCFWLLQNGFKVLVAACDTFRSGAVEQLRVHVRNLKALDANASVELFERGYGKDPAGIAQEAIAQGTFSLIIDIDMLSIAEFKRNDIKLSTIEFKTNCIKLPTT